MPIVSCSLGSHAQRFRIWRSCIGRQATTTIRRRRSRIKELDHFDLKSQLLQLNQLSTSTVGAPMVTFIDLDFDRSMEPSRLGRLTLGVVDDTPCMGSFNSLFYFRPRTETHMMCFTDPSLLNCDVMHVLTSFVHLELETTLNKHEMSAI